jgi:hypothetical protein
MHTFQDFRGEHPQTPEYFDSPLVDTLRFGSLGYFYKKIMCSLLCSGYSLADSRSPVVKCIKRVIHALEIVDSRWLVAGWSLAIELIICVLQSTSATHAPLMR